MLDLQTFVLLLGIVLAVLDGLFTVLVIERGGYELNPVVRVLVKRFGVTRGVLITRLPVLGVLVAFWFLNDLELMISVLAILVLATTFTGRSIFTLKPLFRLSVFSPEVSET